MKSTQQGASLDGIPLRSIPASELGRYISRKEKWAN